MTERERELEAQLADALQREQRQGEENKVWRSTCKNLELLVVEKDETIRQQAAQHALEVKAMLEWQETFSDTQRKLLARLSDAEATIKELKAVVREFIHEFKGEDFETGLWPMMDRANAALAPPSDPTPTQDKE